MINWNTPNRMLEPQERTRDCWICGSPHTTDDFQVCDVCGKVACIDCTYPEFLDTDATICKHCVGDTPEKVYDFLAAEWIKAKQILAAKDMYIDQLRKTVEELTETLVKKGIA